MIQTDTCSCSSDLLILPRHWASTDCRILKVGHKWGWCRGRDMLPDLMHLLRCEYTDKVLGHARRTALFPLNKCYCPASILDRGIMDPERRRRCRSQISSTGAPAHPHKTEAEEGEDTHASNQEPSGIVRRRVIVTLVIPIRTAAGLHETTVTSRTKDSGHVHGSE